MIVAIGQRTSGQINYAIASSTFKQNNIDMTEKIREALQNQTNNQYSALLYTTSYKGNGLTGSSNPCSITFPFEPKIVGIFDAFGTIMRTSNYYPWIGMTSLLTTSYQTNTLQPYGATFPGRNSMMEQCMLNYQLIEKQSIGIIQQHHHRHYKQMKVEKYTMYLE